MINFIVSHHVTLLMRLLFIAQAKPHTSQKWQLQLQLLAVSDRSLFHAKSVYKHKLQSHALCTCAFPKIET